MASDTPIDDTPAAAAQEQVVEGPAAALRRKLAANPRFHEAPHDGTGFMIVSGAGIKRP